MDRHCRLRAPGAARPADCPPPTSHHAALAARLGNARLQTLYDQATWSEGPAWWEAQRTLVWSDVVGRRVLGWREDGAVDVLLMPPPSPTATRWMHNSDWCTASTGAARSPVAMWMAGRICWSGGSRANGSIRPMT